MSTLSVLRIPELMLRTLEACDIPEVAALSFVDSALAGVCELHMQGRVQCLMMRLFAGNGESTAYGRRRYAYESQLACRKIS